MSSNANQPDPIESRLDALGEMDRSAMPAGLVDRIAEATAHAPDLKLVGDAEQRVGGVWRIAAWGIGPLAAAAVVMLMALPALRSTPTSGSSDGGFTEVALIEAELDAFLEIDDQFMIGGTTVADSDSYEAWTAETWLELDDSLSEETP
ncbi:MAG: hypothetical protein AAGI17_03230 [Planctomycetota bacterium]